jgi:DNA-binding transcriptional MerR regulator
MHTTYPGTTIEVSAIEAGGSRRLFDGVFATGGITLSQVSIMTGLEPYMIQNWVKRGFLSPPSKRVYSRNQFARILIINMLKESLQIDRICGLIRTMGGFTEDTRDDVISDEELYHKYVDMLAAHDASRLDDATLQSLAEKQCQGYESSLPNGRDYLIRILKIIAYAHAAASLRRSAETILATLQ